MKQTVFALLLLLCSSMAQASDCKQPLDENTLKLLQLGTSDVQLRPGDTHHFVLAIFTSYKPADEVPACATWKVEPEGKGATIDSEGLLKIDAKTPPGSKFVVTADIEHGRAQRRIPVVVYTQENQPLVGLWKQQPGSGCSRQTDPAGVDSINELEFRADGWFSVTWVPFETYRDYWGSYAADNATRALSLKIDGGNYVPAGFRGDGKFTLRDNNTVELTRIYLGAKRSDNTNKSSARTQAACRYVFTRIR